MRLVAVGGVPGKSVRKEPAQSAAGGGGAAPEARGGSHGGIGLQTSDQPVDVGVGLADDRGPEGRPHERRRLQIHQVALQVPLKVRAERPGRVLAMV